VVLFAGLLVNLFESQEVGHWFMGLAFEFYTIALSLLFFSIFMIFVSLISSFLFDLLLD